MPSYMCKQCGEQEPAVVLITPLNGADSQPVGDECLAVTLTGWLSMVTGVDPEQLWTAIEGLQQAAKAAEDGQAAEDGKDPLPKRKQPGASGHAPTRRRRAPAKLKAEVVQDEDPITGDMGPVVLP